MNALYLGHVLYNASLYLMEEIHERESVIDVKNFFV